MLKVKSPQNFGAGVLFLLIGAAGIFFGRELDFGSTRNMGPGYFPTVICGLIILIGAVVAFKALSVEGPEMERIHIRPILMLMLAVAAFGFLISQVGVVISSILLVILAAYARRDVNILETIIFALAVSAFVVVIFVFALGQPMPIWWNN